jgi:transposase
MAGGAEEMVHKTKRRFSSEFKAQAVELAKVRGKSATAIAKDLGISTAALCRWMRASEGAASSPQSESVKDAEIKRLRKELETAQMERDFLKKAAAFFAKESK